MIAAWNSHLLIASLTLAALTILSVFLTRKVLWRQPAIAHGFLVFVLLGFVVTLPMQFSSKGIVNASKRADAPTTEAELASQTLVLERGPWLAPFDFSYRCDFGPMEDEAEAAGLLFEETNADDADESALFGEIPESGTVYFPEESEATSTEETSADESLEDPVAALDPTTSATGLIATENESPEPNYWSSVAQFIAPLVRSHWLLVIHLVGLSIALFVEFMRYRKTNRIIRGSVAITDPRTLEIWQQIAGPSAHKVQLRASSEVRAPVCWGIARPVVIVPADEPVGRETAAFKWAIRHELVHIRRGDPRTTLFQSVLRSVFWFHPASWWLNREIDRLREISCDDAVVGKTGSRKSYAMALVEYARQRDLRVQPRTLSPTAPALISWTGSTSQLERRIKMLAQSQDTKPRSARLFQAAGAVTVALMLMSVQVAWAANMPTPQAAANPIAVDASSPTDGSGAQEVEPDAKPRAEETTTVAGRVIDFAGRPVGNVTLNVPNLDSPATVSGRIVDQDGRPVKNATIRVTGTNFAAVVDQDAEQDTLTIGVHLQAFSAALAKTLGMPSGSGLIITKVVEGSNAERAGLKKDDPILKIDGNYASMTEIRAAKKRSGGKKSIKFLVMRGAKTKTITVKFKQSGPKVRRRGGVNLGASGPLDSRLPTRRRPSGAGAGISVPGPTNPSDAKPFDSRSTAPRRGGSATDIDTVGRLPVDARTGRRTTRVPRATNNERKLEREVRDLKRQLDRLSRSLERQGEMLERLMKSPRRNNTRNNNTNRRRATTKDATLSVKDLESSHNKSRSEEYRLKAEAYEKARRSSEHRTKERLTREKDALATANARKADRYELRKAEYANKLATADAVTHHARAKKLALLEKAEYARQKDMTASVDKKHRVNLNRLRELENHYAQQKAQYHDLMAQKSAELAQSSARLHEVESALAELDARHANVAAQRAEVATSKMDKSRREAVIKDLLAAEASIKQETEYLRRHHAENASKTRTLRTRRETMIAEYEMKIKDLENHTEMLRRQLSKKKSEKSAKKRVIIFDDTNEDDNHDK